MQQLDPNQLEDLLQKMTPKASPKAFKTRMMEIPRQNTMYQWAGIAALFMVLATVALFIQDDKDSAMASGASDEPVKQFVDDSIKENITPVSAPKEGQFVLPKSKEIVYVNDEPHYKVKYLIMDRKNVEVDGVTMQVIKPREEQYIVPISVF